MEMDKIWNKTNIEKKQKINKKKEAETIWWSQNRQLPSQKKMRYVKTFLKGWTN